MGLTVLLKRQRSLSRAMTRHIKPQRYAIENVQKKKTEADPFIYSVDIFFSLMLNLCVCVHLETY